MRGSHHDLVAKRADSREIHLRKPLVPEAILRLQKRNRPYISRGDVLHASVHLQSTKLLAPTVVRLLRHLSFLATLRRHLRLERSGLFSSFFVKRQRHTNASSANGVCEK
jgi:hypothetical protein